MPFALVTIGLIMIVSGARDTYRELGNELIADFTGDGNFLYWLVALGALGALGTVPQFKGFSRAFMALVLISMVIANRGFASKLMEAIQEGPVKPASDGTNAKLVGSGSTSFMSVAGKTPDYLKAAQELRAQNDDTASDNFGKVATLVKAFFI